ncbi:helix-turn-helix domain-containing protein [Paenibacillus xylanilyticus]|uniref:Helix-turn-helix domain-containing protein n=1 Tax=Paenibacillus xylanilyticus TaxID=248903 RepID=A0A7Y6EUZ2_9BACL|nr:helix-turn-helix transcriptional regulator [Paenibacillus xylanilyticus]NUU75278.1 helix-turn-helix domain-containing protein [Paenibacillus xylanilyticus]
MNQGNRIAELREQRSWTQQELAHSIGISRAALSHYEKSRRKPDFEILNMLADMFNVSIDYLVGRTRQPNVMMDPKVEVFLDQLELSDKDLLKNFNLTIDGNTLTDEEAKRFIAFMRIERGLKS